jgi:hypothetical protein
MSRIAVSESSVYQLVNGAKMMKLSLDDNTIRRHPIAQRTKRDKKRVTDIIADYDALLDLPIIVSYNNGWKEIIDGDHRYEARKALYKNKKGKRYIDAIVYFGLKPHQNHSVFYGLNQKKKLLDSKSKWFNGYHGKDKDIVGAINLAIRLGYTCEVGPKDDATITTKHPEYDWQGNGCIKSLVENYKKCPQLCKQWLIGMQSWRLKNGSMHPDTMNTDVLRGSFDFVKRHAAYLTPDQTRALFARTNPGKIHSVATKLQIQKNKCRKDGQVVEAFARATRTYRKGGKIVIDI